MDQIASLESDNQRLKCHLENAQAESTATGTEKETASVSELVTGRGDKETQSKRPPSLPIKLNFFRFFLLFGSFLRDSCCRGRVLGRAGDLQLIRLLKSGIINLSREIKEVREDILFLEASIDALLAKSPRRMSYLSSEQTTLEEQLAVCERKLEELSIEMGTTQKIESPQEPNMPLHLGPCEGLESIATANKGDSEKLDSLLALEQFRSLLYERNHLRARLIELRAGFEAISNKDEEELVYGPLPKEPFEKMYPQFARPKSAIKSMLVRLNIVTIILYALKLSMFFNADLPFHLLFEAWYIDTVASTFCFPYYRLVELVGACVGIFLLAIIYEAMKGFRDRLLVQNLSSFPILNRANVAIRDNSVESPESGEQVNFENPVVPLVQKHQFVWRSYFSLEHILQTILHGVQLFISYLLMLVFMTYNAKICRDGRTGVLSLIDYSFTPPRLFFHVSFLSASRHNLLYQLIVSLCLVILQ
ncbi:unnamed protein product [Rodentolepis nana]|uniref:Copper transport protein n=1 Tax=Rodentolepis nana TaxID=102285 RepID=A0A0R3TAN6_RODNA|nr:unnamed protein product [Rodentolepis nana]